MVETTLTFVHGSIVLLFGITLSAAFAGIRNVRENIPVFARLYVLCGLLQALATILFSEAYVWKLYPIITHLPLILLLRLYYHKPLPTALASTFTAYLCCQPSKWAGVLALHITGSSTWEYLVRMLVLAAVGYVCLFHAVSCLSEIFNKDRRSVCIFGIVPAVYYAFDYAAVVYSDLWNSSNPVAIEFLPMFLTVAYMIFCFVYYREYEQKADALRNEQVIRISAQQQAKELAAVKRNEQEIRLLRHDMRLMLRTLDLCIENGDLQKARELIVAYTDSVDYTRIERFCANDALNYILSDYAGRCKAESIPFICIIDMDELTVDEVLFCSILSNALDNALNEQKLLPTSKRSIRVMIKISNEKLLLSVKNPVGKNVIFSDGLPVPTRMGHGYGTQSIRYMTEKLGGNCQFSVQNDTFILRVIL